MSAQPAYRPRTLARTPGRAASPLQRLMAEHETGRSVLTDADDHTRSMLLELLETSCLLELSRLAAAPLDLATHLQLAADVLTELFPCRGVEITVSVGGLAPMAVRSGEPLVALDHDAEQRALVVDDEAAGWIRFGPVRIDLGPSTFFSAAADQLSDGIGALVHAEVLRRQARVAEALGAAASVEGDDLERGLRRLVDALATWPGALGAQITAAHPLVGAPLALRVGTWEGDGEQGPVASAVGIRLHVAMPAPTVELDPALDEVAVELGRSMERVDRERRLAAESETDPLTGAGNRRRLGRALAAALNRAERHDETVAVLAIDLDHFKAVNDSLGHAAGDDVLVAVVQGFRNELRGYDELVRAGGEEFVVLAPSCEPGDALRLAERLRASVPGACRHVLPEGWVQTASIGVATFPEAGLDAEALLESADRALFQAKHAGRDAVRVAGPAPTLRPADPPRRPAPTGRTGDAGSRPVAEVGAPTAAAAEGTAAPDPSDGPAGGPGGVLARVRRSWGRSRS